MNGVRAGWGAAIATVLCVAGAGVTAVSADTAPPPHIVSVTPARVPTGQPVRVTITGSGFSATSSVTTDPPLGAQTFTVFNDSTLLLTLPADTPVGGYVVHVTTPGGTDVSANGFTVTPRNVAPATADPAAAAAGASRPAVSLAPAPQVQGTSAGAASSPSAGAASSSATGVANDAASAVAPAAVAPAAASSGTNPVVAALLGFAIGGLLFVLWGKEGRLRVARRQGFLAQVWARPLQRLRVGRICLHCGRLHYLIGTRRDLWKAGQFCSATCFVAHQEAELAVASSEELAPSRMRAATVYVDLEKNLQAALRAEASDLGSSLFTETGAANRSLVPETLAAAGSGSAAEAVEPGDEEPLPISA